MTPEAGQYLAKARKCLEHARAILAIELGEEAGRAAYLAAFHAAQALIFERTRKAAKTHRGVHGQFLELLAGEPRIDDALRRFLSEGYKLKATADYEVGPDAIVPTEEAAAAIQAAGRLVDKIAEIIGDPNSLNR
jgi:uncharacterized protein (UPF0332 family)